MAKFVKWVGGTLGFALGGPVGAILGFALGSVFDDSSEKLIRNSNKDTLYRRTQEGDFSACLLILSAAVMKSDGRTMKSELDYIKRFFEQNFGISHANEQMLLLKEILRREIPLMDVCQQINQYMQYPARLQMMQYLFGISKADGHVHQKELETIEIIGRYFEINSLDFDSIKAMFYRNAESDYTILEVASSCTDEELKKAYRRMAIKFHPDKVVQLGEDVQKSAKEKFQMVQQAYENIKSQRGIN